MRITAAGLVGIGLTPTAQFHVGGVTGSTKAAIINNNTSTGNIFEAQDNGTAVLAIADGGYLDFPNSSTFGAVSNKGRIYYNSGTGLTLQGDGTDEINLIDGTGNQIFRMLAVGTIAILSPGGTAKTLTVNNFTSTGNIFEAQDNGTAVFTLRMGGNAQFLAGGSSSNGAWSFLGDPNSGVYWAGADNWAIISGGNLHWLFQGASTFAYQSILAVDSTQEVGSATYPWRRLHLGASSGTASILSSEATGVVQLGNDVNSSPVNQTFKAHDGITGTDKSGASMTIAGGRGTGTGVGADYVVQTAKPLSTGTTAQTLGDRVRVLQKYTTLTAATPTIVATVAVGTGIATGGDILISVEANDGTDFQCRTLRVTWSAVNKAGTITAGIDTPSEAIAVSAGTLTAAVTVADAGSGILNILVDAASSLTETTLRANCQVRKNFGTGAIA